jgi:hypothetical protein
MTINNNNIFGVFTLNEARGSRLTGDWLNKEFVANYGWFGGGTDPAGSPGFYSTVDRIDFSNDSVTAQVRGSLSAVKYGAAATGNSNYGWFGGGVIPTSPTSISTVERIDFSNDSSTASPRGQLNAARYFHTATGNSNYGWWGGGGASGGKTFIERIDFSNDSGTASLRGSIITPRANSAATGNSNYGWFGGGSGSIPGAAPFAAMTLVDRIDFSNDATTASPRGPLSSARSNLAATGNSNYGWFGGGFPDTSTVDRIDFANDSTSASVRGTLIDVRYNQAATGNSNYGWFGGGTAPGGTIGQVNRIDFSNDLATASVRGGALSLARQRSSATSGVLNIRRQKAGNYGWFGGGFTPQTFPSLPIYHTTVDRIDFSNDSISTLVRGPLSQGRDYLAATGNSNYGWFGGGWLPGVTATVDRIDFANDSGTASVRGPLSLARGLLAATGNSNYGWFGGGIITPGPAAVSRVDRINFSNDLATVSPRGSLFQAKYSTGATGNSNYGWFGAGVAPASTPNTVSSVERIDFSNDSSTTSPRGPLSLARELLAATGNSNYGWFGGGDSNIVPANTSHVSTIDRINFSNDLVTASPRGPLNLARYGTGATGNSNYGWWSSGGSTPSGTFPNYLLYSRVDRIDFSNDSVRASARGFVTPSTGRVHLAATSNTSR